MHPLPKWIDKLPGSLDNYRKQKRLDAIVIKKKQQEKVKEWVLKLTFKTDIK